MDLLSNLNNKQQEAVVTTEGPVLILAGAGSGKTTVLVSRLIYILSTLNVSPYNVLAITFTNKAAGEMKERIKAKIGAITDQMWIGTFHSMCVRILRSYIDLIGYGRDFLIYDTNDTKLVIKECMKELEINEKNFSAKTFMSAISRAKDDLIIPEIFDTVYKNDIRMEIIGKVYKLYQKKMKRNNALDFDDIIVKTIQLLSENTDVLDKYQEKFKYIMVDEYQDTNNAQYMLISLLAGKHRNLCVVGDDDQSIYKFRGANIRNILDFEAEFNDAVTIKLEQNYRSTGNILKAANAIIANNRERKGKNLWTEKDSGDKIVFHTCMDEHDEGRFIAKKITEHIKNGGMYSDCAVLYRMNVQSRVVEEMLMRENIPYRVLAGLRFYDRKEIKDIVAYLRVIYNNGDDVSLRRIINEPKRSIGNTTLDKAQGIAEQNDTTLYDVLKRCHEFPELKRAVNHISVFTEIIDQLSKIKNTVSLSELLSKTIHDTGYSFALQQQCDSEGTARMENLQELLSVVKEYEEQAEEEPTLENFLERIALVSDIDNYDQTQDSVVLMTIHSAKGLEFPVVFLPGMENGIFPGAQSLGDDDEMQEERRLCYVAVTRSKEKLFITRAERRMIFGKTVYQPQSVFITEIPSDCIESEINPLKSTLSFISKKMEYNHKSKDENKWRKTTVVQSEKKFKTGDSVIHPKFGHGTVISSVAFGDDCKVEVLFDSFGKKTLMSNFAKLEKAD